MLSQIHKLGENYEEWVNLPVDRPLRLFDSDFIESFSRAPWYYIPLFWIPVIIILCYYGTGLIPKDQNVSKFFVQSFAFLSQKFKILEIDRSSHFHSDWYCILDTFRIFDAQILFPL